MDDCGFVNIWRSFCVNEWLKKILSRNGESNNNSLVCFDKNNKQQKKPQNILQYFECIQRTEEKPF